MLHAGREILRSADPITLTRVYESRFTCVVYMYRTCSLDADFVLDRNDGESSFLVLALSAFSLYILFCLALFCFNS